MFYNVIIYYTTIVTDLCRRYSSCTCTNTDIIILYPTNTAKRVRTSIPIRIIKQHKWLLCLLIFLRQGFYAVCTIIKNNIFLHKKHWRVLTVPFQIYKFRPYSLLVITYNYRYCIRTVFDK